MLETRFWNILNKYKINGSFSFRPSTKLSAVCNAPGDKSGVYMIYKAKGWSEELIYIGSSGQKNSDDGIKHRKGGIKDRLVNGKHPHQFERKDRIARHRAFPAQMIVEKIPELKFYWWVTHDDNIYKDFPTDVEAMLTNEYRNTNKRLPDWHKQ